jgi:hypothetical protein
MVLVVLFQISNPEFLKKQIEYRTVSFYSDFIPQICAGTILPWCHACSENIRNGIKNNVIKINTMTS